MKKKTKKKMRIEGLGGEKFVASMDAMVGLV